MPGMQTLDDTYIVFDIETTGFSAIKDKIIEIGAVKVVNGRDRGPVQYLCQSAKVRSRLRSRQLTSITDEMVTG